jgi:prepilin-type N-terminal cleavage/methylation domain-containing protein
MRNNLKQRKSEGFTIIEVMIVLAIAGLIMLIVFLAVPALQRNAHNTSIKNDVSGILGAMNEATNNNSGTIPNAATGSTANSFIATNSTAGYNKATANLGYVDGTKVTFQTLSGTSSGSAPTATSSPGTVVIYLNAVCDGNKATAAGATSRNYAAMYSLEGGAVTCQAS